MTLGDDDDDDDEIDWLGLEVGSRFDALPQSSDELQGKLSQCTTAP